MSRPSAIRSLEAVISTLAGLPAVYKRTFDAEKPLIIPLCTIFVAGLGWQGLIKTAGKFVGV